MVKHSKGYRTRTRKLLKKNIKEKGSIPPLGKIMKKYAEGEYVSIKINPSFHYGMPHRRYHGKVGIIAGKRGRAYEVKVNLGDKEKLIIVRPEHLETFKGVMKEN